MLLKRCERCKLLRARAGGWRAKLAGRVKNAMRLAMAVML